VAGYERPVGFDVMDLSLAMSKARERKRGCKKGDKRPECRKGNRRERVVFPMLYPSRMGTPRGYRMGTADGGGYGGDGNGGGAGGGDMAGESAVVRSIFSKFFRRLSEDSQGGTASKLDPGWGGFSIPNLGQMQMRGGGPTIGGPGFQHDGHGEGGVYNFRKSPGLGFRSEAAWMIWDKALDIMSTDKTLNKQEILMRASAKANLHRGQIDPAELRLIEMGIEWYLSDPGALAAKRTGGSMPPGSGGHTGGGWAGGRGAP